MVVKKGFVEIFASCTATSIFQKYINLYETEIHNVATTYQVKKMNCMFIDKPFPLTEKIVF